MSYSAKFSVLLSLLLLTTSGVVLAQSGAVNTDPDFDTTYANPSGPWVTYYIGTYHPAISKTPKGGEGWPSGPALFLFADGKAFEAGVYQVVSVTPGRGYHFEVAWAVVRFNGGVGAQDHGLLIRSVGIDPTGGTNPLAPTVKWSGEYGGSGKFAPSTSGDLQVDEYARGNRITVFLRARNSYVDARSEVYFDHAILTENAGMGVITIAPPTPTAAPATATRAASPTQARTRVAQAPAATATTQLSPSPTATEIPTNTPQPTATRTRRPTVAPEEAASTSEGSSSSNVLILIGALVAVGIGLGVFGFVVFHLLGRTM